MDKQVQDKLWNELSERSKKFIKSLYYNVKDPNRELYDYEDIVQKELLESICGEHNLNPKQIKTWEDVEKLLPEDGFCVGEYEKYADNPKVTLKCQATLKIAKLIELGYGGMVSEEEWKDDDIVKHCPIRDTDGIRHCCFMTEYNFIAFHNSEQFEEFMSYESNRKLVEMYYLM